MKMLSLDSSCFYRPPMMVSFSNDISHKLFNVNYKFAAALFMCYIFLLNCLIYSI